MDSKQHSASAEHGARDARTMHATHHMHAARLFVGLRVSPEGAVI